MPALTSVSGKKLNQLGYKTSPAHSVYAFTMTSIGDIYCHVLLACDATEAPKAIQWKGLPIGATSIPVPNLKEYKENPSKHGAGEMTVRLSNTFPVPSSAVTFSVGCKAPADFNSLDINALTDSALNRGTSSHTKIVESASDKQFPRPFGDLSQEEVENENFDTLLLVDKKKPKSESYASINQDDLNRQVEVVHPAAGYGLSINKDASIDASNVIKLSNRHALVALPKDDVTTTSRDVHVGDLTPNLLQTLGDDYFKSSGAKEEDGNQFVIKEEYYSDDNDSMNE